MCLYMFIYLYIFLYKKLFCRVANNYNHSKCINYIIINNILQKYKEEILK